MASTITQKFHSYPTEDGVIYNNGDGTYTVDKNDSLIYTSSSSDTLEARVYLFLPTGDYFANNFPSATITGGTFRCRYNSGFFDGFTNIAMTVSMGANVIGGTLEDTDFVTFSSYYSYFQVAGSGDTVMDQLAPTTYTFTSLDQYNHNINNFVAKSAGQWTNIMFKMTAGSSTSSYTYVTPGTPTRSTSVPLLTLTFTHNLNTYTTQIPAITGSPSKLSVPSKLSSPTFFRNP